MELDCSATINDGPIFCKAYFNVIRPTAVMTSIPTANIPPVNVVSNTDGSVWLQYGTFVTNAGLAGMYVSCSVSTPTNCAGAIVYVQVVDSTTRRWINATNQLHQMTQGSSLIDSFGALYQWGLKSISSNAMNSCAYCDSPAEPLIVPSNGTDMAWASADDAFSGYAMFRPSGDASKTIWVTLRKFSWNWSGAATQGINGSWSLDAGYPLPSITLTNQDTTELPQWSGPVSSLTSMPDDY